MHWGGTCASVTATKFVLMLTGITNVKIAALYPCRLDDGTLYNDILSITIVIAIPSLRTTGTEIASKPRGATGSRDLYSIMELFFEQGWVKRAGYLPTPHLHPKHNIHSVLWRRVVRHETGHKINHRSQGLMSSYQTPPKQLD